MATLGESPMPCFCSLSMRGLSGSLPPPLPAIVLPSAALNVLASVSAAMNASAAASASANLALSATASAKLALLASVNASLKAMGMASLNANLAGSLAGLIGSLNGQRANLAATADAGNVASVSAASLLAAVMANLMKMWGINLAAPAESPCCKRKLNALAQAQLAASASAAASAAASASASASLSAQAALLAQMAASMGLPLGMARSARAIERTREFAGRHEFTPPSRAAVGSRNLLGALAALREPQGGLRHQSARAFGRLGNCQRRREG